MVGVALAVGVGVGVALVGLTEVVGVGVGVGEGDELHPLRSNAHATVEAANTAEILGLVILQIYLLSVQVKKRRAL